LYVKRRRAPSWRTGSGPWMLLCRRKFAPESQPHSLCRIEPLPVVNGQLGLTCCFKKLASA
jgi:hypothetical protein